MPIEHSEKSLTFLHVYALMRSLHSQTTTRVPAATGTRSLGRMVLQVCRARLFEFHSINIMNEDTVDASKSSVKLNNTDKPGAHLDEPFEAMHGHA